MRERRGERVIGYKIGCISRVIQEQLGIHQPIFGRVFDTGCFPSGSRLSHARFADLAVEGELALRLCRDLPDSPLPDDDYVAAIGSVTCLVTALTTLPALLILTKTRVARREED